MSTARKKGGVSSTAAASKRTKAPAKPKVGYSLSFVSSQPTVPGAGAGAGAVTPSQQSSALRSQQQPSQSVPTPVRDAAAAAVAGAVPHMPTPPPASAPSGAAPKHGLHAFFNAAQSTPASVTTTTPAPASRIAVSVSIPTSAAPAITIKSPAAGAGAGSGSGMLSPILVTTINGATPTPAAAPTPVAASTSLFSPHTPSAAGFGSATALAVAPLSSASMQSSRRDSLSSGSMNDSFASDASDTTASPLRSPPPNRVSDPAGLAASAAAASAGRDLMSPTSTAVISTQSQRVVNGLTTEFGAMSAAGTQPTPLRPRPVSAAAGGGGGGGGGSSLYPAPGAAPQFPSPVRPFPLLSFAESPASIAVASAAAAAAAGGAKGRRLFTNTEGSSSSGAAASDGASTPVLTSVPAPASIAASPELPLRPSQVVLKSIDEHSQDSTSNSMTDSILGGRRGSTPTLDTARLAPGAAASAASFGSGSGSGSGSTEPASPLIVRTLSLEYSQPASARGVTDSPVGIPLPSADGMTRHASTATSHGGGLGADRALSFSQSQHSESQGSGNGSVEPSGTGAGTGTVAMDDFPSIATAGGVGPVAGAAALSMLAPSIIRPPRTNIPRGTAAASAAAMTQPRTTGPAATAAAAAAPGMQRTLSVSSAAGLESTSYTAHVARMQSNMSQSNPLQLSQSQSGAGAAPAMSQNSGGSQPEFDCTPVDQTVRTRTDLDRSEELAHARQMQTIAGKSAAALQPPQNVAKKLRNNSGGGTPMKFGGGRQQMSAAAASNGSMPPPAADSKHPPASLVGWYSIEPIASNKFLPPPEETAAASRKKRSHKSAIASTASAGGGEAGELVRSRFTSAFEYIRDVSSGSFGDVLEARRRHDGVVYAVKRLRKIATGNKKREAQLNEVHAMAAVQSRRTSPALTRYVDSWFEVPDKHDASNAGSLYIVLEWCARGSLSSHIKCVSANALKALNSNGTGDSKSSSAAAAAAAAAASGASPMTPTTFGMPAGLCSPLNAAAAASLAAAAAANGASSGVVDLATEVVFDERAVLLVALHVAQGLEALHSCGIAHLDIKPDNVLQSSDGQYKIADFGLATPLTTTGSVEVGDKRYLAAEALELDNTPTHASTAAAAASTPRARRALDRIDMFALGVSLFELCLCGRRAGVNASPNKPPTPTAAAATVVPPPGTLTRADSNSNGLLPLPLPSAMNGSRTASSAASAMAAALASSPFLQLPSEGSEWHALRTGSVPFVAGMSNFVYTLIKALLHPDPSMRPTARTVVTDVMAYTTLAASRAPPPPPPPSTSDDSERKATATAAAAAARIAALEKENAALRAKLQSTTAAAGASVASAATAAAKRAGGGAAAAATSIPISGPALVKHTHRQLQAAMNTATFPSDPSNGRQTLPPSMLSAPAGDTVPAGSGADGPQLPELTSIIVTGCHPHLTMIKSSSSGGDNPTTAATQHLPPPLSAGGLSAPAPSAAAANLSDRDRTPSPVATPSGSTANNLTLKSETHTHVSTSYRLPPDDPLAAGHRPLQSLFAPVSPPAPVTPPASPEHATAVTTANGSTAHPAAAAAVAAGQHPRRASGERKGDTVGEAKGGAGPVGAGHERVIVVSSGVPPEMLRTPSVVPSSVEGTVMIIKALADKMFQLQFYTFLCVLCFLLNLFLLIWGLTVDRSHTEEAAKPAEWYIAIDVLTTFLLLFEVGVRIIATRKSYFRHWYNWLDVGATAYAVVALFFYLSREPPTTIAKVAVLVVRYSARAIRICITVKEYKDHNQILSAANDLDVDFNGLELHEERLRRQEQAMIDAGGGSLSLSLTKPPRASGHRSGDIPAVPANGHVHKHPHPNAQPSTIDSVALAQLPKNMADAARELTRHADRRGDVHAAATAALVSAGWLRHTVLTNVDSPALPAAGVVPPPPIKLAASLVPPPAITGLLAPPLPALAQATGESKQLMSSDSTASSIGAPSTTSTSTNSSVMQPILPATTAAASTASTGGNSSAPAGSAASTTDDSAADVSHDYEAESAARDMMSAAMMRPQERTEQQPIDPNSNKPRLARVATALSPTEASGEDGCLDDDVQLDAELPPDDIILAAHDLTPNTRAAVATDLAPFGGRADMSTLARAALNAQSETGGLIGSQLTAAAAQAANSAPADASAAAATAAAGNSSPSDYLTVPRPVLTAGVSPIESPQLASATPAIVLQTGSVAIPVPPPTSSTVDAMHPVIRLARPSMADLDDIEGPAPAAAAQPPTLTTLTSDL